MKYIFTFFLLTLVLISCVSDDDIIENNNNQLLIKTIIKNGSVSESFEYDTMDRLITRIGTYEQGARRISIDYNNEGFKTVTYYNESNQKVRVYKNYLEDGNVVRFEEINPETNDVLSYKLYTVNTNTCNLEKIEYYSLDDQVFYTIEFNYTDNNCSAEITLTDDIPNNRAKNVTINDSKNSSIKAWDYPFYGTVFKHNRLSYTNYTDNDEIIAEISYSNVYIYNEFDYPVSQVQTYLDGTVVNYEYQYY